MTMAVATPIAAETAVQPVAPVRAAQTSALEPSAARGAKATNAPKTARGPNAGLGARAGYAPNFAMASGVARDAAVLLAPRNALKRSAENIVILHNAPPDVVGLPAVPAVKGNSAH